MNPITACRSCGATDLPLILSLGETPLANSLLNADQLNQPESRYPLDVVRCNHCSLVQITETVSPETLFREYLYFSSFSDTMLRHARQSAESLIRDRRLDANSLVVEIASNDGYLLQYFKSGGIPVIGIEPAANIAKVAEERGIRTISEFFGPALARKLAAQGELVDVILANNVIAHIPDINGVAAGIKALLKPGGLFVMETPYVKDMLDNTEFDTIYHEHLFYYSLAALENLFGRHDLAVVNVERIPIHGGSLRLSVAHKGAEPEHASVEKLRREEAAWGVETAEPYARFASDVSHLRDELLALLQGLKREGRRVAAYGASAKGSTLLNAFGIGADMLDFVVDRSTIKQGWFTPGTHLEIYAPEKLIEAMPDDVLLLTWNFVDEILAQQAEYRQRGGRFIIPLPKPNVV